MKLSIKMTLAVLMISGLTQTSTVEAGKSFGKINGGSQSKSRNVRRPSTANFHHNFNYKQRGGSSSSNRYSNFRKPTVSRNSSNSSSRFKSINSNSRLKTIGTQSQSRTRDLSGLKKFENIRKPTIQSPTKGKGLFDGKKPGDGERWTIQPVDPNFGQKSKPGYGNDIIFPTPRPRPRPPIFCPPGRRPIVCLPPINICPPVYTPCVTTTCQQVIVEPALVEQPVQEELEPVLQLVVGQPAALEANGLGQTAGQVVFEVNGLGLPAKVTQWEDAMLAMDVPMMGLQGPTNAFMHLIGADGQPLASIPVELLMEAPQNME